ncbi:hypothetical protein Vadar_014013 [Vaccinium darrowii]|uniref:Uncharacterized protein n=1 Tax=Vaccinium darrowii TaxID=229202 RepID=A0ACB7YWC9_9ERIC|nr:hypothetical protein Vadar_014013 [Vaccinium darrowii]
MENDTNELAHSSNNDSVGYNQIRNEVEPPINEVIIDTFSSTSGIGKSIVGNEVVMDSFGEAIPLNSLDAINGSTPPADLINQDINVMSFITDPVELELNDEEDLNGLGHDLIPGEEENNGPHADNLIQDLKPQLFSKFSENVRITVGDGKAIIFWSDPWVDGNSLCNLYPNLFRTIVNKKESVAEVFQRKEELFKWDFQFRRNLFIREMEDLEDVTFSMVIHMEVPWFPAAAVRLVSQFMISITSGCFLLLLFVPALHWCAAVTL